MQLHHIRSLDDPLIEHVKNDPVRPHIPIQQRVNDHAEILVLKEAEEVLAVTCMAWTDIEPATEQELETAPVKKDTAVFYTIWSYKPGAGAKLLREAANWLKQEFPNINSIVTLSPHTEMAKRFHLNNGAEIARTNETTINYRYYKREAPLVSSCEAASEAKTVKAIF